MPEQDYWKTRFEALNGSLLKEGMDFYDDAEVLFRRAQNSINKDIAAWYQRFADNNQITLQEAKKWLRGSELEEFRWTVDDYIRKGRENGISADWAKQLENASARFHISRLEALKVQMRQHLEELYGNYQDGLDRTMRSVYEDAYYRTAYTMQEGYHTGFEVAALAESEIDAVMRKPWAADGSNFSDRIWKDKAKLLSSVETELTQGLIRGDPQDRIVKKLAERMGVSRSNAARLVATESAFFAAKGELDNMKELGVEKYQFLATLDRKTSDVCRSMDMKIFPLTDFQPGVTAPPLHCYCRSCTVPYMGENAEGLRAARDEKGKTMTIPDMAYEDWKAVYVDKTKTLDDVRITKKKTEIEALKKKIQGIDLQTCSLDDVITLGKEVDAIYNIEGHLGDKNYLKNAFETFQEMGGKVDFAKGCSVENKKQLIDAFSCYPKRWADYLAMSGKKIYTKKVRRGFFCPGAVQGNGRRYESKFTDYRNGYVSIHMTGIRKTTPFHEIGHMVEYFNPNALRVSKLFLKARTAGENPVQLKRIFPSCGYGPSEITKPDDFISPYIGKDYKSATEVLSMGIEQIYEPTDMCKKEIMVNGTYTRVYATIKQDKEYLYFIIGMILKA